jgi:3-hydroxyisobutyrate dehydrogenase-like beta-hydroxyacid dehydrogenase
MPAHLRQVPSMRRRKRKKTHLTLGGTNEMAKLGFVGLGVMGSELANRLLSKGHSVTGYNRTREKANWLIKKGMKWADSPCEVSAASEVIFSMVTNSAALQAIVEGPDGILAGLAPGKLFADISTVGPVVNRNNVIKAATGGQQDASAW